MPLQNPPPHHFAARYAHVDRLRIFAGGPAITTYECRQADHRSLGHQAEFWPSTPFVRRRSLVDGCREYPAGSYAAVAPNTSHSCAIAAGHSRSEEHTSELQSRVEL